MKLSNMKNYEFYDSTIAVNNLHPIKSEMINIYTPEFFTDEKDECSQLEFELSREDVIALAIHYELTAKDLKQ